MSAWLPGAAAALLLAACSGVETHTIDIQTAATGTRIEAKQVVALVYAQQPDAAIDKLLYFGGDLSRAVKRLRDRYPQLETLLDQGVIGNTESGFVALREPSPRARFGDLLRDENNDRAWLYREATDVVGHGGGDFNSWLPYASYSFGKEWIAQGRPGWWWLDESRQWRHARRLPGLR